MNIDLGAKTAVVTGATSGIGFATSKALLEAGARVIMVSRSERALQSMAAPLNQRENAFAHVTDLLDSASCEAMIPEILEKFGRIDILHCNAGSYIGGALTETNATAIDKLLNLNINAVFKNIHAALPHMIENGGGDIVVSGSISGHRVLSHEPVYSASKHAVYSFVQAVRRQTRNTNVRISQISPGPVVSALLDDWPKEKLAKAVEEGAVMDAAEVADALIFLLSRPRNVTVHDVVIMPTVTDF